MENRTYVLRSVLCICLFVAGLVPGFSQQIEKGIRVSNGDYLGFLEYKPTDYASKTGTRYPLIIFLHGIGERGNGTTELKNVACCGLPRVIKRGHDMTFTWNGKTETFIVLSPQCPKSYGMWPNLFIEELINYAKTNLRIDENRIFLTGLSMGGGGTYKYISTAAEQPKRLAAAATICAPCTFKEGKYPAEAKLPLWSFHAADDAIAPASCTEMAVRKINEQNPVVKPLKTIWPTGGHIVWDRVYTDTNYRFNGIVNIYEWFLGQNKTLPANKLPVANAGNTINITTASGVATLNGSASSDPDGKIVRYVWKKIEGPSVGIISSPFSSSATTTVTGLTLPGTYKYELNVVDNRASYTSDVVTVVVTSDATVQNNAPVSKAGTDINITLPVNAVSLDGSSSYDSDGSIASYLWTKVSGPSLTISSPSAAKTMLNNLIEGTYVLKLKVTDNKGAVGEDQVTVVVKPVPAPANLAPIARAGVNFSITLPVNSTTLDGTGSEDPDGTIKTFSWTKLSGPAGGAIDSPAAATTKIRNLVEGTYTYKLVITDNAGAKGEDQITITVKPQPVLPNVSPVSNAGSDISITLPVNSTTLNGTNSKDEDGSITTYQWSKVSGPASHLFVNPSAASTEIRNLVEGIYEFRLKVTDNRGATSEDIVRVVVNPAANIKPVANAGADVVITLPVNKTVLNGSKSSDEDGSITDYKWTYVSGPNEYLVADASVMSTNLTQLVEGTYSFMLEVTDNKGAKSYDTVMVTVLPAPPPPNVVPVAQAGTNVTITLPENATTLNGSASSDQDGTIVSYQWSYVSGPESFIIAEPQSPTTAVSALSEGSYYFRLEVQDNSGAVNADTVSVIVKKADVPPPPPNKIPRAIAGDDITITLPLDEVTLDGSRSVDDDGTLVNYSWQKIAGPSQFRISSPSYHITSVTNLAQGTYQFRLQVKDNDGALDFDTITVTVLHVPNMIPVSRAGADVTIQLPVNQVQLNGNESYDQDGTISKYRWQIVSGPAGAEIASVYSAETVVSNLAVGEHVFRLTVTDNEGALASDVIRINVLPEPPNVGPVAIAGNDKEVQLPLSAIKLDGSGSYDSDGYIASYSWVKSEGAGGITITNSSTATPSIIGLAAGEYAFRLTVTDDDGSSSSDVVRIIVMAEAPAPNQRPLAHAGNDQVISYPQSQVSVDGAKSKDMDGNIIFYEWKLISGPSSVNILNPNVVATGINQLQTGEYIFELLVKDDKGEEARDTVNISVVNTMRYEEHMTIYPNPAVSTMNVQLTSDTMGLAKITIYNSSGSVVKSFAKEKSQVQLFENVNVSNLQTGLYYVEVMIGGKLRKISKFIKRQ